MVDVYFRLEPPARPPPPVQSDVSSPSQVSSRQSAILHNATNCRSSYSEESVSSDGSVAVSSNQKSSPISTDKCKFICAQV